MKINPQISQISQIFFTQWAWDPLGGAIRVNPPAPKGFPPLGTVRVTIGRAV